MNHVRQRKQKTKWKSRKDEARECIKFWQRNSEETDEKDQRKI